VSLLRFTLDCQGQCDTTALGCSSEVPRTSIDTLTRNVSILKQNFQSYDREFETEQAPLLARTKRERTLFFFFFVMAGWRLMSIVDALLARRGALVIMLMAAADLTIFFFETYA